MGLFRKRGADARGQGTDVSGAAKIVAVKAGATRGDEGPVINLHLLVTLPGEAPFPTSVAQLLSPPVAARCKPGARVPVSVDRATRTVAIDWGAVPA